MESPRESVHEHSGSRVVDISTILLRMSDGL
jgi:hypothetical protein